MPELRYWWPSDEEGAAGSLLVFATPDEDSYSPPTPPPYAAVVPFVGDPSDWTAPGAQPPIQDEDFDLTKLWGWVWSGAVIVPLYSPEDGLAGAAANPDEDYWSTAPLVAPIPLYTLPPSFGAMEDPQLLPVVQPDEDFFNVWTPAPDLQLPSSLVLSVWLQDIQEPPGLQFVTFDEEFPFPIWMPPADISVPSAAQLNLWTWEQQEFTPFILFDEAADSPIWIPPPVIWTPSPQSVTLWAFEQVEWIPPQLARLLLRLLMMVGL